MDYMRVSLFIAYKIAIDLALYIHEMEAQKLPEDSPHSCYSFTSFCDEISPLEVQEDKSFIDSCRASYVRLS